MQSGMHEDVKATSGPKLLGPGLLLGTGLGAFVDGIVLHQLLRWHHLLSARPGVSLRTNLIADGVFHAGAWLAVLAGVLWLWRRSPRADANGSWRRWLPRWLQAGDCSMSWKVCSITTS